jgi:type IV pilus assembly protein PilB
MTLSARPVVPDKDEGSSKLAPVRSEPERKQIALALLRQREAPRPDALRLAGYASIDALAESVANQLKLPRLQLDEVEIAPGLITLLPRATAERHWIVPVFSDVGEITFATSDPSRLELFDWLGRELKSQILIVVATSAEVRAAIQRLYEPALKGTNLRPELGDEVSAEALREATGIFDHLVARGSELGASDIHIEATERGTCIRFRIDGVLRVLDDLPVDSHAALVSRVKILAQLDISERQAPQDGRIKMKLGDRPIDLRVSVLPTIFGEKVCCRILDNTKACLPLAELGFEAQQLVTFEKMIRVPYGLLLVTGPTGSGKSTTLYGALNTVRSPELNIVSVEDPVEYQLPGINQVQVNTKRGLTFAGALRSILRQDPNVVLIGEIRDRETGIIAAEAALTGHLVMASMHTNDAASAITRLTEMGIEPFLVAPSLIGVIAQRLIRKICLDCKETYVPTESELLALGLPAVPAGTLFSRGRGCGVCQRTGYRGRTAVREILEVDEVLRQQIGQGETAEQLRKTASAAGFRSMRFQALRRLFEGITTAPEVIRITRG